MKRFSRWTLREIHSLLLIFFLAGCGYTPIALPTTSLSPSITTTAVHHTSTAISTPTAIPIPTETVTSTATETKTQVPTNSPTPAPTLSRAERDTAVLELLKSTSGCRLPCWWGIKPGQSTWDEAQFVFMHLGFGDIYKKTLSEGMVVHSQSIYFDSKNTIGIDTFLYEKNDMIVSININGNGNLDGAKFRGIMLAYSPENIFVDYGIPSRIWVSSSDHFNEQVDPGTKMFYKLFFYYDDLGFLIVYDGLVDYQTTYHICPSFSANGFIDGLELYMQPANSSTPLENLTLWGSKEHLGALTLEEAAGISVQDFFNLYKNATGPVCFDTPRDIWK